MSGDLEQLMRLAREHGCDLIRSHDDPNALTTLHLAAAAGHQSVVDWLLSEDVGADPAALRGNNFSPLHSAAMNGHARICQTLLISGAVANVQTDPQGTRRCTAPHGAATSKPQRFFWRTEPERTCGTTEEKHLMKLHSARGIGARPTSGGRTTPERKPWWKFW